MPVLTCPLVRQNKLIFCFCRASIWPLCSLLTMCPLLCLSILRRLRCLPPCYHLHIQTPLISQHPSAPSICATCLASFPLCCSPPQSCDCYCVVPATQKLAWPNLNQCYWSRSCFISQHKGCAPHFRGSTNECLIGGVLCRQCCLPALIVSSPAWWCSVLPSLLTATQAV